ncbi:MAG: hypothetical protein IJR68_08525 [Fretibacterium sp.]|nr:hypothetical protein [Fretibacterium sp.]
MADTNLDSLSQGGKDELWFTVLGLSGAGKTTLLACMYEELRKKKNFIPDGDRNFEILEKAYSDLEKEANSSAFEFTRPVELPSTVESTQDRSDYCFTIGDTRICFCDFPGGWIARSHEDEDYKKALDVMKRSRAILAVIDAPYLMENNGRYMDKNYVDRDETITIRDGVAAMEDLIKESLKADEGDKLILLIPTKCEGYTRTPEKSGEMREKVKALFAKTLALGDQYKGRLAIALLPIHTVGNAHFERFEFVKGEEKVEKQVFRKYFKEGHEGSGVYKSFCPRYVEQPLCYVMSFLLGQTRAASLFDRPMMRVDDMSLADDKNLIYDENFAMLCGSDIMMRGQRPLIPPEDGGDEGRRPIIKKKMLIIGAAAAVIVGAALSLMLSEKSEPLHPQKPLTTSIMVSDERSVENAFEKGRRANTPDEKFEAILEGMELMAQSDAPDWARAELDRLIRDWMDVLPEDAASLRWRIAKVAQLLGQRALPGDTRRYLAERKKIWEDQRGVRREHEIADIKRYRTLEALSNKLNAMPQNAREDEETRSAAAETFQNILKEELEAIHKDVRKIKGRNDFARAKGEADERFADLREKAKPIVMDHGISEGDASIDGAETALMAELHDAHLKWCREEFDACKKTTNSQDVSANHRRLRAFLNTWPRSPKAKEVDEVLSFLGAIHDGMRGKLIIRSWRGPANGVLVVSQEGKGALLPPMALRDGKVSNSGDIVFDREVGNINWQVNFPRLSFEVRKENSWKNGFGLWRSSVVLDRHIDSQGFFGYRNLLGKTLRAKEGRDSPSLNIRFEGNIPPNCPWE